VTITVPTLETMPHTILPELLNLLQQLLGGFPMLFLRHGFVRLLHDRGENLASTEG
jgi:hypothetical protein